MERWLVAASLIIQLALVLSLYCEKEKPDCQLEYIVTQGSKKLCCPNISTEDESHISWHYRKSINTSFTGFPFSFCSESLDFVIPECEIDVKGNLILSYGESAYEGFYQCSTNYSNHCFQLKLYECKRRQKQVVFEPPPNVRTFIGSPLRIKCGADFGCDKNIKGQITWEVNGREITDSNNNYHICQSSNITYLEAELLIDKVEEDDFHQLFACVVKESKGSEVRRFNVSLINQDPVFIFASYRWIIELVIGVFLTSICFLVICIFLVCLKFPLYFFFINTNLSCLGRFQSADKKYHVFILHEQDDSYLAHDLVNDLSDHNYTVCTSDEIQEGTDLIQAFKDLINNSSSLIVIYPQYPISESFDHQITIAKQTLVPYFISALVLKDREDVIDNVKLKELKLKKITIESFACVYDQLHWRLPTIRTSGDSTAYTMLNI